MANHATERQSDNLLLIAVRAPVAGETKTRLGAAVGMQRAALLYAAFIEDLAVRFMPQGDSTRDYDLGWAVAPTEAMFREAMAAIDGFQLPTNARFVEQVGADWTVRQVNLLQWGHDRGYARTVLIASDSPQLRKEIPTMAFCALAEHDVALGRVRDGGYYLIGQRGTFDLLSSIEMSTGQVAERVACRAYAAGLRMAELPTTFDVDDGNDLDQLVDDLAPDGAAAPATWRALHRHGLIRCRQQR